MEIILGLIAIGVAVAVWYFNRNTKGLDVNADGKVDSTDVKQAVQNTVAGVTEVVQKTADVNKDGKVDASDAKVVVEKTKEVVKKTANKARRKKPAAKA